MIVIDASALLEILLRSDKANGIMDRAFSPSVHMHAPQLLDIEITQVLRRLVRQKEISVERGAQALQDLADLPITRHEHQPLVARIWQLRGSFSAYDGAYVALAEALAAPLLTCDGKLAGAHGHRAIVELVGS